MSPLERDARCVTDSIRRTNDARVDYLRPVSCDGLFSGRYFPSAEAAAKQFQYEARLCWLNSRELHRFGRMHCMAMQRQSAELYAAARSAIATGAAA